MGSDPIIVVWHQDGFSGTCVAPGGPEEGGGGEEQVALTSTAHDLFDAGLWTIDDNLRIQVAHSDISESILPGGSHFKLSDLHGQPLCFNPQATLRPNPAHLAWHRREVFGY